MLEMIRNTLNQLKKNGFFHIFGASTLNKIISFASSWIIVRIISKAEYGVYTHAYNKYGFLILLSGLGIASAVLQLGSEAMEEREKLRIYRYGLRIGLFSNLLLSAAVMLVGLFVPLKIEGSNSLLIMMTALPLVTIVTDLQFMYLRINLRNKQFSALSLINSIAVLAFSCALAFLLKAPGLVLAGYCSHLFTAIIANRIYRVPLKLENVRFSEPERKTVYSIALISMVNNGLSHLMYLLDVFVIGLLIAESEVIAAYKIATNIPTALQFIPAAILLFVYPHFARNKDNKNWVLKKYRQLIIPFGLFNLITATGLFFIAKPLIGFIFGVQYLDAVTPFRILCISYFFSATFRAVAGSLLVTQRKLKFNLGISVFAAALNLTLNYFLIRSMQMTGAAIATLITTAVCGTISTVYFLYYVKYKNSGSNDKPPKDTDERTVTEL